MKIITMSDFKIMINTLDDYLLHYKALNLLRKSLLQQFVNKEAHDFWIEEMHNISKSWVCASETMV